jgi:hypothetical protein
MCEALRASEGNTYCKMEVRVSYFSCLFVAPGSSRHGWPSCHKLLIIYKMFFKGLYKMTLLAAVILDGNNDALPLA